MEVKTRKNNYNHEVLDCPFCPKWVYLREARANSPDPLRDLKRHITQQAKNEALDYYLDNSASIKHLDYYSSHTEDEVIVPKTAKRQYDNDLVLGKSK